MSTSKTNELALETAIENALTGTCFDELSQNLNIGSEPIELYRAGNGFYIGNPNDYNAQYAIDEVRFWHFLESTQRDELEKLQRSSDWKLKIVVRLDRMIKKYGVLRILRKGLQVEDAHFTLLFQLPMASSSQAVKDNFEKNEFSVTRQVHYNTENLREEIDMVVFINGLPIATLELKNAWTGQSAKVQGIRQYMHDRDFRQPLLQFGRCIVHFAVDTDEVYMCTKLNGADSFFLPFNKGNNNGKGNPPNPFGHRTAYLWEEVFTRESLANIIQHFVRFDGKATDNPLFNTIKAQKKLRAYVESHKQTIGTKAGIIVDHFFNKVYNTKKLKGKAKAMVVTQNIESAIRYYLAIKEILKEKRDPFKIAVAFSGKKTVNGIDYTEAELNGFSENDTRDKFDTDDYRMLVVANKYLTGFDQPKLCTMYVDKKLQGVMAVQALSRLNRSADKLGKKTEDLFVLDFFNEIDDIKASFDPFYTSTSLSSATDINVLHELKGTLDIIGVYEWEEVEDFVAKYFNGLDAQFLSPIIDAAANRFNVELELEDEDKADFKIKAKQFVKIYGQMASIMPYEVIEWEKLFWFLKFLIPKLIVKSKDDLLIDELLESVDLSTYGLERTKLNHTIGLDDSGSELNPQNPNPRGVTGEDVDKDPLDEIITSFNEKWFHGWDATPEEHRIKFLSLSKHIQAHPDYQTKVADNYDVENRDLAFKKILDDVMGKQRRKELELYKLYAKDESFYQALFDTMKRIVDNPKLDF